ncbi:Hypothetical predicted protein [Pelobates cultripes]|uniref:Uncharacterized protein n=1 Tax=Pelobates cultripes TaxID=61616 RepID=A0AAD1WCD6_PELCU|nr:Hypothetical predicted protein [Pelobates cultripes]
MDRIDGRSTRAKWKASQSTFTDIAINSSLVRRPPMDKMFGITGTMWAGVHRLQEAETGTFIRPYCCTIHHDAQHRITTPIVMARAQQACCPGLQPNLCRKAPSDGNRYLHGDQLSASSTSPIVLGLKG